MTDPTTAREHVTEYFRRFDDPNCHVVITDEVEYDFGWMFFYNSQEFVDSGDYQHALLGNAPLVVDRSDGQLYFVAGTAASLEGYVEDYRKGKRHRAEQAKGM